MSDPNLPNDEQASQPTTPLQPPAVEEPQLTSQLPSDFQPGAPVPPPAPTTPFTPGAPQQPQASQPQAPQPPAYGSVPPQQPQAPQPPAYGAAAPQQPGAPVPPGPQAPIPSYAAGGYPPAQPKGLAITALIVGIASLVFCWVPFIGNFIGLLGGAAALLLGILALRKAQSKGMSITGIITGGLAVVISVIGLIFWFTVLGAAVNTSSSAIDDLKQLSEEFETTSPSESAASGAAEGAAAGAAAGAASGAADGAADGTSSSATGERSAEFCAALDDLTQVSTSASGFETTPELIAAYERIASIDSPNQELYKKFSVLVKDPSQAATDDYQTVAEDFASALFDDSMACM